MDGGDNAVIVLYAQNCTFKMVKAGLGKWLSSEGHNFLAEDSCLFPSTNRLMATDYEDPMPLSTLMDTNPHTVTELKNKNKL